MSKLRPQYECGLQQTLRVSACYLTIFLSTSKFEDSSSWKVAVFRRLVSYDIYSKKFLQKFGVTPPTEACGSKWPEMWYQFHAPRHRSQMEQEQELKKSFNRLVNISIRWSIRWPKTASKLDLTLLRTVFLVWWLFTTPTDPPDGATALHMPSVQASRLSAFQPVTLGSSVKVLFQFPAT